MIGVNQILGEPKICYTQSDPLLVEIEDLQALEFARNYNSPLTNLRYIVLV